MIFTSLQLIKCFQAIGIAQGSKGARSNVDKISAEFDRDVIQWKEQIEACIIMP